MDMNTQQVDQSTSNLVESQLVLTDILKMTSPQGVLLRLKNKQEVMQTVEKVVMDTESILDFHHVRVLQGGVEVDLFVMSSLASSLSTSMAAFTEQGEQNLSANSLSRSSLQTQATESALNSIKNSPIEPCQQMIQGEIDHIFHYKKFWKDSVMAQSRLQQLVLVQNASNAFIQERGLLAGTQSESEKAAILRDLLTKCLDEELCPDLGNEPSKKLSTLPKEIRNKWINYWILRWQYIDGESSRQVENELKAKGCWAITGGTYRRHITAGREALAALIWQKEMQAQKTRYDKSY